MYIHIHIHLYVMFCLWNIFLILFGIYVKDRETDNISQGVFNKGKRHKYTCLFNVCCTNSQKSPSISRMKKHKQIIIIISSYISVHWWICKIFATKLKEKKEKFICSSSYFTITHIRRHIKKTCNSHKYSEYKKYKKM